jgi:chromosome segregation ATPase
MSPVSPKSKGSSVSLSPDLLKNERERLRTHLREIEVQQREAEAALKAVRQRELRIKREIEALTTLIDLAETDAQGNPSAGGSSQGAPSDSTSGQ